MPIKMPTKSQTVKLLIATVLATILTIGAYVGYLLLTYPTALAYPKLDHYHFRMQLVIDGKEENFGDSKYQTAYEKDSCSEDLPEQPIHFHDNKNQIVHIHWKGVSGGMVLKNYGWNHIGGDNSTLAYRLDSIPFKAVATHGSVLPALSKDTKLFVYAGNEKSYSERKWDDFVRYDLETFFNKKSTFAVATAPNNPLDFLFPTAYAHDGHNHDTKNLEDVNNLIGNVVIFAQQSPPTHEEIAKRFTSLEPLTESTCGG